MDVPRRMDIRDTVRMCLSIIDRPSTTCYIRGLINERRHSQRCPCFSFGSVSQHSRVQRLVGWKMCACPETSFGSTPHLTQLECIVALLGTLIEIRSPKMPEKCLKCVRLFKWSLFLDSELLRFGATFLFALVRVVYTTLEISVVPLRKLLIIILQDV